MQFSNILSIFALASAASAVSVSYDTGYDDGSRSLTAVSCSDGPNGLMTRYGWQTQAQVARFPYIGGAPAVGGWNSPGVGFFLFLSCCYCYFFRVLSSKEHFRLTVPQKSAAPAGS